ncbi:MAG: hypothetical protein ACR2PT_21480 [Endozoicomonas sp.]
MSSKTIVLLVVMMMALQANGANVQINWEGNHTWLINSHRAYNFSGVHVQHLTHSQNIRIYIDSNGDDDNQRQAGHFVMDRVDTVAVAWYGKTVLTLETVEHTVNIILPETYCEDENIKVYKVSGEQYVAFYDDDSQCLDAGERRNKTVLRLTPAPLLPPETVMPWQLAYSKVAELNHRDFLPTFSEELLLPGYGLSLANPIKSHLYDTNDLIRMHRPEGALILVSLSYLLDDGDDPAAHHLQALIRIVQASGSIQDLLDFINSICPELKISPKQFRGEFFKNDQVNVSALLKYLKSTGLNLHSEPLLNRYEAYTGGFQFQKREKHRRQPKPVGKEGLDRRSADAGACGSDGTTPGCRRQKQDSKPPRDRRIPGSEKKKEATSDNKVDQAQTQRKTDEWWKEENRPPRFEGK